MRLYQHKTLASFAGTQPPANALGHAQSNQSLYPLFANLYALTPTIGVAAQTIVAPNIGYTGDHIYTNGMARFASPLLRRIVQAQNWTFNYAFGNTGSWDKGGTREVLYVWRPTSGIIVGTIYDSVDVGASIREFAIGTNPVTHRTVAGAAVPGALPGDIVIFEAWLTAQNLPNQGAITYYLDGTVINTAQPGGTAGNHAGFIESTDDIWLAPKQRFFFQTDAQDEVYEDTAALTDQTTLSKLTISTIDSTNIGLDVSAQKVANLGYPTAAKDVASKQYVDDRMGAGFVVHAPVRLCSSSNVSVSSAPALIDGLAAASGNRVLLVGQNDFTENGVYIYNGSGAALTRAADGVTGTLTPGSYFFVNEGTSNSHSAWVVLNDTPITVGTDLILFDRFSGLGQINAGSGLTKTGDTLDVGKGDGLFISASAVMVDLDTVPGLEIGPSYGAVVGFSNPPVVADILDYAFDNSHAGTISGPALTYAEGRSLTGEKAGVFGGSSYIQTGITSTPTAFTIAAWIKPTAFPAAGQGASIIGKLDDAGAQFKNPSLEFDSTGTLYGHIPNGTSWLYASAAGVIALNRWTHVALTYASGVGSLYVNGSLVATVTSTLQTTATQWTIGRRPAGTAYWYTGHIDQAQIYSRALKAQELLNLSYKPRLATKLVVPAGLVHLYQSYNSANHGGPLKTNTTYTFSIYVKTDTGTKSFAIWRTDMVSWGSAASVATQHTATTSWQRFSITFNTGASGNSDIGWGYNGKTATQPTPGNYFVACAQLEEGSSATAYIGPTFSSSRAAIDGRVNLIYSSEWFAIPAAAGAHPTMWQWSSVAQTVIPYSEVAPIALDSSDVVSATGVSTLYLTDDLSTSVPTANLTPYTTATGGVATQAQSPRKLSDVKKSNGAKTLSVPTATPRLVVARFATDPLRVQTIGGTCTIWWATSSAGGGWYYRPIRHCAVYIQRGTQHINLYNGIDTDYGYQPADGDGGSGGYGAGSIVGAKHVFSLPTTTLQGGDVLMLEIWWNGGGAPGYTETMYFNGATETDVGVDVASSANYASRIAFSQPIEVGPSGTALRFKPDPARGLAKDAGGSYLKYVTSQALRLTGAGELDLRVDGSGGAVVGADGFGLKLADSNLGFDVGGYLRSLGLPSLFKIGNNSTGISVTSANLDAITGGGLVNAQHMHAAQPSAGAIVDTTSFSSLANIAKGAGVYISANNEVSQGSCTDDVQARIIGVSATAVAVGAAPVQFEGILTGVLAGAGVLNTRYFLSATGLPVPIEQLPTGARVIQLGIGKNADDLQVEIVDYGRKFHSTPGGPGGGGGGSAPVVGTINGVTIP